MKRLTFPAFLLAALLFSACEQPPSASDSTQANIGQYDPVEFTDPLFEGDADSLPSHCRQALDRFNLREGQLDSIIAILETFKPRFDSLRNLEGITPDQRHEAFEALINEVKEAIKPLLTDDQQEMLDQMVWRLMNRHSRFEPALSAEQRALLDSLTQPLIEKMKADMELATTPEERHEIMRKFHDAMRSVLESVLTEEQIANLKPHMGPGREGREPHRPHHHGHGPGHRR